MCFAFPNSLSWKARELKLKLGEILFTEFVFTNITELHVVHIPHHLVETFCISRVRSRTWRDWEFSEWERLWTFYLSHHRKSVAWINHEFFPISLKNTQDSSLRHKKEPTCEYLPLSWNRSLLKPLWTDVNWKNRGWERNQAKGLQKPVSFGWGLAMLYLLISYDISYKVLTFYRNTLALLDAPNWCGCLG